MVARLRAFHDDERIRVKCRQLLRVLRSERRTRESDFIPCPSDLVEFSVARVHVGYLHLARQALVQPRFYLIERHRLNELYIEELALALRAYRQRHSESELEPRIESLSIPRRYPCARDYPRHGPDKIEVRDILEHTDLVKSGSDRLRSRRDRLFLRGGFF